MRQVARDGWKAPTTQGQVRDEFFAKHGDDSYTRSVDRYWSRIGRLVEKGSKIRDGMLRR